MADLGGFDANTVEDRKEFQLIPAGTWVEAMITNSEEKPNKKGTGKFVEFVFDIVSGPFKGYHLWTYLNLKNPNATCVAIAKSELKEICKAVGVDRPRDSVDLHNLPMMIKVGIEKGNDGKDRNVPDKYAPRQQVGPIMAQTVQQMAPAQAAQPQTLAQAAGAAPWQR
jgi:hypothetical protein